MAWTDIDQYKATQLVAKADLDTLKDNIEYLHAPNAASYQHPGTGSDYTVSGQLGVDIDSTNFKLTITSYGGLILTGIYGVWTAGVSSNTLRVNIIRDELIAQQGRNVFYDFDQEIAGTVAIAKGWIKPFLGLPAGSHTFRVVWGCPATGTLTVAFKPYFWVVEI